MFAIGPRRGVAAIAFTVMGLTALPPITNADPPIVVVSGTRVTAKAKVYTPPPYVSEVPAEASLNR